MAIPRIFISYRREDTIGHAGRLFDRLAERFGREHVYRDVDTIVPGADFIEAVRQQIDRSDILLALIGPRWLTAADEKGEPRLADEKDLVRVEIARALKRDIVVIPVLVQGAAMPKASELPGEVARLAHRNAAQIRDTSFDADVARLVENLEPDWRHKVVRAVASRPVYAGIAILVAALAAVWTYQEVSLAPDRARSALAGMGLAYNAETFVQRARENDAEAVKLFLRAGIAPDAADEYGRTALREAAAGGHLALATILAEAGADIDKALPWAARYGRNEVADFLLARQPGHAAISAAMVYAVINGRDTRLVQKLLDKGADANFLAVNPANRYAREEPALILAANEVNVDIVRLLLARGAEANVKGAFDRSPIQVAISPSRVDGEGKRRDQMEIVKALLTKRIDLEAHGLDYWQLTPLLLAIYKERPEIALLLIDHGADANTQAAYGRWGGRSALMLAAEKGMTDVVKALLDKKANVNARDERGETALHVAAKNSMGLREPAVAQALLAAGVEVNARNNKGETALMLIQGANRVNYDEFVQALLASGGM